MANVERTVADVLADLEYVQHLIALRPSMGLTNPVVCSNIIKQLHRHDQARRLSSLTASV